MIIGLTGKNGSGKGAIAKILVQSGFVFHSLSDILREELKLIGLETTRENLIGAGRRLREEGGASVLAERTLTKMDLDKNYVVDSIRNPSEVTALKKRDDFYLWCVEANQKTRFNRICDRARAGDPLDFDTFVKLENEELASQNPAGQQLVATAKLADLTIANDTSLTDLETIVKDSLRACAKRITRPDWDHYFMEIAKVASLRSNCVKRKVAAVLVKDKRVISTGYNGTPRGLKNCSDGGCERCNSFGPSGVQLSECLCSHAEENSIVQAAYHGVSVAGATLYTTFSPCLICTKMILNSGIKEVVYQSQYPMGDLPLQLLKQARMALRQIM